MADEVKKIGWRCQQCKRAGDRQQPLDESDFDVDETPEDVLVRTAHGAPAMSSGYLWVLCATCFRRELVRRSTRSRNCKWCRNEIMAGAEVCGDCRATEAYKREERLKGQRYGLLEEPKNRAP